MAKMSKSDIIAKLETLEVEFDEGATQAELFALLKEAEQEAGEVDDTEEDDEEKDASDSDENQLDEAGGKAITNKSADGKIVTNKTGGRSIVNKVIFKIRNPNEKGGFSIREFSLAEHGEDYKALADEFEQSNTHTKVTNMTDAAEVAQVTAHNNSIKHPVIERVSDSE